MSTTPFADLIKQAAEAKFVVIPASDYPVVAATTSATKSSTGKDMIKLTVKVVGGAHQGASIPTQQTLTADNPVAVQMFLKFLAAFGLDEEWLAELPPRADGGPDFEAVARALKGRVAIAAIEVGQWNDEDRNEVKRFKKPTAEQEAGIKEALEAMGQSAAFGAPDASGGDPFAAAAAAAPAGGEEPF